MKKELKHLKKATFIPTVICAHSKKGSKKFSTKEFQKLTTPNNNLITCYADDFNGSILFNILTASDNIYT